MTDFAKNNKCDSDTEYQPVTDHATKPLTSQTACYDNTGNVVYKCYLHPNANIDDSMARHERFKAPIDVIDANPEYLDYRWSKSKAVDTHVCDIRMFRSLKDIQFKFADDSLFRHAVLPYVDKTRRYRISGYHNRDYVIIRNLEGENLQVLVMYKGKPKWLDFALRITDVSALMGIGGLFAYAENTGHDMTDTKKLFTQDEKGNMTEGYYQAEKFDTYARGDVIAKQKETGIEVCLLSEIMNSVNAHVNNIAVLLGVEPLSPFETWGMSTGTIVARLMSKVIANRLGISVEQLQQLTQHGGTLSLQSFGRYLKLNNNYVYLTMVDGGRANNERQLLPGKTYGCKFITRKVKGVYTGVLCDIDISGCYANGLMNQIFPIGIPQVLAKPMSLREFWTNVLPKCVPGCYYGRISWENAPFQQDLLISKIPEAFTDWDWGVEGYSPDGFSYESPEDKTYDAGMLVTTNSVHQASFNHDLLQTLYACASKPRKGKKADGSTEWEWLLDNATVTGVIYYDKDLRVDEVRPEMLESVVISTDPDKHTVCDKHWIGFDLSQVMSVLIPERSKAKRKYGKKSPQQTFLKLVNNTIYGCIASVFFNVGETVISNVVAGNNITARARCLAWLMAKGLGTFQSITDGGVFDLNSVIHWKKLTLDGLANLYTDNKYDSNRNQMYTRKTLLSKPLTEDVMSGFKGWQSNTRKESDYLEQYDFDYLQDTIDYTAWQHLKEQFKGVDLLTNNHFTFESKSICLGFTPHNKVNYCLYDIVAGDNIGSHKIALRGMNKLEDPNGGDDKIVNPVALELFEAYEKGVAIARTIETTKLLSLADWKALERSNPDKYRELSPDDQVSDVKTFFSITPLNHRYKDLAEYIAIQNEYQDAKASKDADRVAKVGCTDENMDKANKRLNKLLKR